MLTHHDVTTGCYVERVATFLLIHGACHGAWCWEAVAPLLHERGHEVVAPDLPCDDVAVAWSGVQPVEMAGGHSSFFTRPGDLSAGADGRARAVTAELRERRLAVVREHMESENDHDFDTTIATFGHPRYELVATGDVYDGEVAVRAYFAESRRAFPDQRN